MRTFSKPRRPRNPLVALARCRRAGRHGGDQTTDRQRARRELRTELDAAPPWRPR